MRTSRIPCEKAREDLDRALRGEGIEAPAPRVIPIAEYYHAADVEVEELLDRHRDHHEKYRLILEHQAQQHRHMRHSIDDRGASEDFSKSKKVGDVLIPNLRSGTRSGRAERHRSHVLDRLLPSEMVPTSEEFEKTDGSDTTPKMRLRHLSGPEQRLRLLSQIVDPKTGGRLRVVENPYRRQKEEAAEVERRLNLRQSTRLLLQPLTRERLQEQTEPQKVLEEMQRVVLDEAQVENDSKKKRRWHQSPQTTGTLFEDVCTPDSNASLSVGIMVTCPSSFHGELVDSSEVKPVKKQSKRDKIHRWQISRDDHVHAQSRHEVADRLALRNYHSVLNQRFKNIEKQMTAIHERAAQVDTVRQLDLRMGTIVSLSPRQHQVKTIDFRSFETEETLLRQKMQILEQETRVRELYFSFDEGVEQLKTRCVLLPELRGLPMNDVSCNRVSNGSFSFSSSQEVSAGNVSSAVRASWVSDGADFSEMLAEQTECEERTSHGHVSQIIVGGESPEAFANLAYLDSSAPASVRSWDVPFFASKTPLATLNSIAVAYKMIPRAVSDRSPSPKATRAEQVTAQKNLIGDNTGKQRQSRKPLGFFSERKS